MVERVGFFSHTIHLIFVRKDTQCVVCISIAMKKKKKSSRERKEKKREREAGREQTNITFSSLVLIILLEEIGGKCQVKVQNSSNIDDIDKFLFKTERGSERRRRISYRIYQLIDLV